MFQMQITLGLVLILFGLLTFTSLSADIVLLAGVLGLVLFGIITPGEALAGLSNEGMVTVAILYVVGAGVRDQRGGDCKHTHDNSLHANVELNGQQAPRPKLSRTVWN